uniref:Homeobox domain-containing protein n=1 Tax=Brugia malayi TaxID=6279 RepID=A0A5S6PI82_BRUMA
MTTPPNFNSVAMLPGASYFYPTTASQASPKWLTDGNHNHYHLHHNYHQPNSDDQIPRIVSSSGFRTLPATDHLKYSADVRWPSEFAYSIPGIHPAAAAAAVASVTPSASEAYPTDPFPSTSMAQLSGNCCLSRFDNTGSCYYPNPVLASPYTTPTANEHFAAAEHIAHWKVPTLAYASLNGKRSATIRLQQQQSTSPPYRTGPGTNNVRVRTSEKYRMVYSDYQRLELEKEFRTSQFINSERKSQLSSELQLTERQIKIWFQNSRQSVFVNQDNEESLHVSLRRAKDRRENKKTRMV